jgi:hypothetical protein
MNERGRARLLREIKLMGSGLIGTLALKYIPRKLSWSPNKHGSTRN